MSEDELKRGAQDAANQKNEALGVSYIKALAERGNASAQLAMGDFYKTGHVVEVNAKQAVYWYRKAAEQGNPEGNTRLALAYLFGTLDMPVDYQRAFELFNKAAAENEDNAITRIGWMYENGKGVPLDYTKAMEWYMKASDRNAEAQERIGILYFYGWGVKQDNATAATWIHKSANQGLAGAQSVLGSMYLEGLGVPQDFAEAMRWFRRAAEQGQAHAQNELGRMYLVGMGVPKNSAEAVRWFRQAAENGDDDGQYFLGGLYAEGTGVKPDAAQARFWLTKAAAQGHEKAKALLAKIEARKAQTSADTAGKVPPALEFRCVLDARVPAMHAGNPPQVVEAKYVECLRSNWKRLHGSAPFPADR
ncbi:SEL1-like repeat protein [Bradyrhizobium iriomotense]|uniref:Sel1 repeat family protein n=1 Tax=Bradyrhizobium iriomotense TaxID=441950 RepID=A0ABQ6B5R0_9BRAD|nr:tetratricopeptide repeat protein [Bradyrhizobium iriomotense]GLR89752.1 hypothetical protein GCM10007857_64660 [Bradyrhizobium iriomotense]